MTIAEQPPVNEPKPLRWTKAEYYRLGEMGFFDGKRVELIDGEIIEMQPIGVRHLKAVVLVADALRRVFDLGFFISVQNPMNVGDGSDPQPDVAVFVGDVRELTDAPTQPVLVVEVADSSLDYDRVTKGSLYARAGISDYWIVNLVESVVEVRRRPVPMPGQPFGFGYADISIRRVGDTIAPLAAPNAIIAVADLLP